MEGGRWRRRLPHFSEEGDVVFVTFGLADSLPQARLAMLVEECRVSRRAVATVRLREQVAVWLDAGYGSCALQYDDAASLVRDALFAFDGCRYDLLAWCVMPTHVHVLIRRFAVSPGCVVQSWKGYAGRRIMAARERFGYVAPRNGRVWGYQYWDRVVRGEDGWANVARYIHCNPVAAGLCAAPEEWRWSSARDCGVGALDVSLGGV